MKRFSTKLSVMLILIMIASFSFTGCKSFKPCKKDSIPVETSKSIDLKGGNYEA